MKIKIGIIGGLGVYDIEGLENCVWIDVEILWGVFLDQVLIGIVVGIDMVFLLCYGCGYV